MPDHGLSSEQIAILAEILAPYAAQISRVELFGSRATGTYRPHSDIDLVLFGSVDEKTVDHLWTLFSDSSLPFKVDVKAYDHIAYPPLKAHIDRVGQTLLTQADLQHVKRG